MALSLYEIKNKIFVDGTGTALPSTSITETSTSYTGVAADTKPVVSINTTQGITLDQSAATSVLSLAGSANGKDTIIGGAAGIVAYGGGIANDTITLNATNAQTDTVWFGSLDGNDSVSGFTAGGYTNATADVVKLYNSTLSNIRTTGFATAANNNVVLTTDSSSKLTLTGAAGATEIKVNTSDNKTAYLYINDDDATTTFNSGATTAAQLANETFIAGATTKGAVVLDATQTYATDIYLDQALNNGQFQNIDSITGGIGNNILRGNANDNAITSKGAAGTSSVLWGGTGGKDTLTGSATGKDEFWYGKTNGADNIATFTAGTNATDDVVYLYDAKLADATISTTAADVTIGFDTSNKLTVTGAASNTASIKVADSTGATKNVLFATNAAGNMTYASAIDIYYGNSLDKAVTDTATDGLDIYLANGINNAYNSKVFVNVDNFTTGTGTNAIVRGNANNNTLTEGAATTGTSILWGGAGGNDTLVANAAAGKVDFWFGANNGIDSVQGFIATNDSLKFYDTTLSDINVITNSGDITFSIDDAKLIVANTGANGVIGNEFQIVTKDAAGADVTDKAIIGSLASSSMTASATATVYVGNAANKTVDGQTMTTLMDVYLANDAENAYNSTKFINIDNVIGGSGYNILRGNANANTITAGTGTSILWGGAGGNDTLNGNTGVDTFWYGTGDGNDVVNSSTNLDSVLFYTAGITTTDVKASVSGTTLTLTVGEGTLTVKDWSTTSMNTFQFGIDGDKYELDSSNNWVKK